MDYYSIIIIHDYYPWLLSMIIIHYDYPLLLIIIIDYYYHRPISSIKINDH